MGDVAAVMEGDCEMFGRFVDGCWNSVVGTACETAELGSESAAFLFTPVWRAGGLLVGFGGGENGFWIGTTGAL